MSQWMIYGANGYTGKLIAQEAKRRGLTPILAGRNSESCLALGQALGMKTRIFSCESADEIAKNLSDVELVLHCAGPFSATSAPMLEACIRSKAHYLDITGEISVFEGIHSQNDQIRQAGVVAIPGVGFDVVPTDCIASMLKEKMPDANHLSLSFNSNAKISVGTAKTMIEGLNQMGAIRKDGKIKSVPVAYKTRMILFDKRPKLAMTIGWGDVSTAFYSTGIPNIEVYLPTTPQAIRMMKTMTHLRGVLGLPMIQNGLKKIAQLLVKGPNENERASGQCLLWGEVTNSRQETTEMRLKIPEGYSFTADAAVSAVQQVLRGGVGAGARTPSQAFGSKFVMELRGVELIGSGS